MKLSSPGFQCGEALPALYTRQDANVSPPLYWTDLPSGTASLALICIDPDASRLWYHWVLWNIPTSWPGLLQRFPQVPEFQGARQGRNTYGTLGYDGPEPPPGESHRYLFKLYALDRELKLVAGAPGPQLERTMDGKILAVTGMKGLYTRPQPSYSDSAYKW